LTRFILHYTFFRYLFKDIAFSPDGLSERTNFRSFIDSVITLVRLLTQDGWEEVSPSQSLLNNNTQADATPPRRTPAN
jgi:hypothetical protein